MRKSSLSKHREKLMFTIGHDGKQAYIEIRGKRIANLQAKTWVSLEPGWRVFDNADLNKLTIEYRDHERSAVQMGKSRRQQPPLQRSAIALHRAPKRPPGRLVRTH
jgi:hypothetical protein